MKGGWEAIQPMLGDEKPKDCSPWMWSDAAASAVYVLVLVLIAAGVI